MWKRNGLSLVLLALTVLFIAGQALSGLQVHNEELVHHGRAPLDLWHYLASGHFISATFENWESEFLQMGMYVLLTVSLRQRGSAESRPLDPAQEHARIEPGPTPWPVLRGGIWKTLYGHSLAIAFGLLFLVSFSLHAVGSWKAEQVEQQLQGLPPPSFLEHLTSSTFWFESMQNWQSEFLAVLALVVLTIFLRQKDSPQSKPVQAPHAQTGD
ncbi:hypothetical protein ERT44_01670 [Stenotrophomonas sp. MA5]|jgi:hypothetical protein|uniref:DUF6766 family protein n=1 Tax=Stenotrophomonas TaxID=40323 RepID=UPI0007EF8A34|nr:MULTISPECIES: DUF6766 family protein [Stenotrophomonas]MBA0222993.1 hypothetical protein [Stenotrophomonas maltophilia]OBU51717.1 hypothetical protein A9K76_03820 [Stenotrophomonas maltophilia]RXK70488.1 hypothetical protein ERT44_01670 [Stenotrophomonas sp. MA5]HDS1650832.1 hypothetical protein [Stenotrophomonas maltophilia]